MQFNNNSNHQCANTKIINEYIAHCEECEWSIYVHPPNNNEENHIVLAQRHKSIHNHESYILTQQFYQ